MDARPLVRATGLTRHFRVDGGLFVPHVDHADAFLDAGGFRQQHRPAHDEEEVLDPFFGQTSGDNFRAGQFGHVVVSCLGCWKCVSR